MNGHRIVKRPMVVGEDDEILAVSPPWRIAGTGVFDPETIARDTGLKIQRFYRGTGGSLGPLGAPTSGLIESAGSTRQDFQLGTVVLDHETATLEAYTYYDVEVKLADLLADDLIDEHQFHVPAQYIKDIAEQAPFEASFRRHPDVLGSEVQFNWPRNDPDEFLFSDGGGSYGAPVALFLSLILIAIGATETGITGALINPENGVHSALLRWLVLALGAVTMTGALVLLYAFPDGRFVPDWTK